MQVIRYKSIGWIKTITVIKIIDYLKKKVKEIINSKLLKYR